MSRYLFALLLALALLPASASAVIIDTFDDPADATANLGFPVDSELTAAGSFLGNRTVRAFHVSGPNDVTGAIDADGSSVLNVSIGANTVGAVSVSWTNIGGVDLTLAGLVNALALSIGFDDLIADVRITVADTSAASSVASIVLPGLIFAPVLLALPYANFVGGADFTVVEFINLEILPRFPGTDIQIDFLDSIRVPEPTTGMLMALGVLALSLRGRREV